MSAAADAIARKKLRVDWDPPDVEGAPARDALLDGIWTALRAQHAAPATSQDEWVQIRAVTAGADPDTFRVVLRYVFDRDFASQYDATEAFDAVLVLDAAGALITIAAWGQVPGS